MKIKKSTVVLVLIYSTSAALSFIAINMMTVM